ncbi:Trimethyllysine dioxygenase [Coniophora puteana RWD-64-598 SS2]|uniref:trimethyllysine dioxygenase n=1 Tax=Coniophora puteana (strain RWD-64-598) TaxID=741705 RepID=A0A5M3MYR5_CONPW|nr:Trimethyllysine dioxygenase [Coniophora puteana RWD-64-598 SS2]EIW84196.1 Trimethyllysine dioxygenase [Coniophora puteana RWD-64-598 SS2]
MHPIAPARRFICTGNRKLATAATQSVIPSNELGYAQQNDKKDDFPTANIDDRKVSLMWEPHNWSRFHHVWLRDHCRCPDCFHPITKQRLVNTFDIPPDIKPINVRSTAEGLEVTWPATATETHSSFYPWFWLQENTYDPSPRNSRNTDERVLWGSRIANSPPTVTHQDVMGSSDHGLYKYLSNVDKFGFCLVTGVPATPEATEQLSERIGFIRETQYGKFWEFTADLSKGDTAYTTMALGAHTDNTYFTDPCGLQLFHLLSHTEGTGGATLLVDGFYVASILKELHPNLYALLARVPVPAHAAGEPSALYRPSPPTGYPTLRLDAVSDELVQVRWNNDDRSVMSHLDPSLVEDWYKAIRMWNKLLTSQDSEYWIQLTPGTVLTVDNHRVLHGRSAFDGKRRVCGAYIGVDEYRSKLAVLQEKFSSGSRLTSHEPSVGRSVWSPSL